MFELDTIDCLDSDGYSCLPMALYDADYVQDALCQPSFVIGTILYGGQLEMAKIIK